MAKLNVPAQIEDACNQLRAGLLDIAEEIKKSMADKILAESESGKGGKPVLKVRCVIAFDQTDRNDPKVAVAWSVGHKVDIVRKQDETPGQQDAFEDIEEDDDNSHLIPIRRLNGARP